jgi:hypothetical protein
LAGKQKIDDWFQTGRELAERLTNLRYGERQKIYAEFEHKTGLQKLYLRRLFMAAEAITFIARFDRMTAIKMQSLSLKAAIAIERWLHYAPNEAISAARALVDGELSVVRCEKLEREARAQHAAAVAFGNCSERPEERARRFELIATDYVRQKMPDRKLSWVVHDVSLLEDPLGKNELPDQLRCLTAPPFFDQVWSCGSETRPLAVAFHHTDTVRADDSQHFQKTVFALLGLASFGLDSFLICNQLELVEAGKQILKAAMLNNTVEIIHLNLPER